MSLPLTTRFGADPVQDLEIANKRYVDNNASGAYQFSFGNIFNVLSVVLYTGLDGRVGHATQVARRSHSLQAGTFSNLDIDAWQNGKTIDMVITFRINDADGNQVVTVPASTTGLFSDDVNTDAVIVGDFVNLQFSAVGGSGTFSPRGQMILFTL